MKKQKTLILSIRIIFIFLSCMVFSFIPEYYKNFFNDQLCTGVIKNLETNKYDYYLHYGSIHYDIKTHWGYRHWLFFFMGISLFIIQILDLIDYLTPNNKK